MKTPVFRLKVPYMLRRSRTAIGRGLHRFVCIEMHPGIYASIIAVNVAVFFAVKQPIAPSVSQEQIQIQQQSTLADTLNGKSFFETAMHRSEHSLADKLDFLTNYSSKQVDSASENGSPNVQKPLATVFNSGVVEARPLLLGALSKSDKSENGLPPPPPVFTAKPKARHSLSGPVLVPPPPPMIPNGDVALWADQCNAAAPIAMVKSSEFYQLGGGLEPAPRQWQGGGAGSAGRTRSRLWHHARQLIVTK